MYLKRHKKLTKEIAEIDLEMMWNSEQDKEKGFEK